MINIVDEIFNQCDREALAILAGPRAITFGELAGLVNAAAKALELAGVGNRGAAGITRVGLHCTNGIDHICWSLAILRCGGILIPVAPELSHAERDEVVCTTGLDAILCAGDKTWHAPVPRTQALCVQDQEASLLTGFAANSDTYSKEDLDTLNPALIRFSSGTTGQRKGVILSHETLLARVTACNAGLGIGPGDRIIWTLPMAHHFAVSIVLYLLHGATTVLAPTHNPVDIQHCLMAHQGTVLYGAPYHHALLASHPATVACPTLRLAVSTAAPLPIEVAKRFHGKLGIPLTQAMGLIEMGLPLINLAHTIEKPGSVGRPQPGFACRVVDESGRDLPADVPGELLLRGPGHFDAYLSPWIPGSDVMQDGWFPTGDVARIDADGDVTLVGRIRAVINVGGMKVFPEEVETVLCRHADVAEAMVYSAPNATFGSIPVAEIVPRDIAAPPATAELEQLCRQALSAHKIPRDFTLVSALPKTPSGKIRRT